LAISLIIAPPRYGKSTMLASLCKKYLKKGKNVYSNVYIQGAKMMEIADMNLNLMQNGVILLDEAGIDFDNRAWKNFGSELTRFFKLHGHYFLDIFLVSQDYDIDSKIRNLAVNIFVVQKSFFYPYVIKWRSIVSRVDIAEDNSAIVKTFHWKFPLFDFHYKFSPPLWKMFDSHYQDILNEKKWITWCKENEHILIKDYTKAENLNKTQLQALHSQWVMSENLLNYASSDKLDIDIDID
jgi:hypothetical protein